MSIPFIASFAWRDSRGSRGRMLLFISSMVLGVAALVSINSFGDNLEAAIDNEARTLLGADLSFESDDPFPAHIEALIDSIGGNQSRRTSFSSMAFFPARDKARLATVRAHEPGYPFYGSVVTEPAAAAETYLDRGGALVDGTLMNQFQVETGDSVRIGRQTYPILGRIVETPRESAAVGLFSPRIYIPMAGLDTTLTALGSRVEYEVYFQFPDGRDADVLRDSLRRTLREADIGSDTVREEQEGWSRALTNLYRFLGLVGFMSLLLGGLGVASSIHVYVKQRIPTVAVLRVYGASIATTVAVYLLQAIGMGIVGVVLGSIVGIALQTIVPVVLSDFLPVNVDFAVSWPAILLGSGIGLGVTVLFTLLPLLRVRSVSPLDALRTGIDHERPLWRDPWWWTATGTAAAGLVLFALIQAPDWKVGLGYSGGLAAVFLILAALGKLLVMVLARLTPASLPYVVRQGIANLYRPNNQTLMMIFSLGLGTFLISTLLVSQHVLLDQMDVLGGGDQPNLIMYDIQPDQVESVQGILSGEGVPIMSSVPIVTMRLHGINNETIDAMREDTTRRLSWAHRREYRSTFRSTLTGSETLVEGTFRGTWDGEGTIPVSAEADVASELGVDIGDRLTWNVQGVMLDTEITSLREVDWQRLQTNFFFVFPEASLEGAPAFHVVMTRAEDDVQSARLQTAVVQAFPNVSSIDLALVIGVFDAIFSRISFVVRFMALFSILTGLIVLASAVVVSRFQRMQESVLLKTLGASRRVVLRIMAVEYIVLGFVSALTGILLALVAGWSLSHFVFEAGFVVRWIPLSILLGTVMLLTLVIGMVNSRGVYERGTMEVLRSEL